MHTRGKSKHGQEKKGKGKKLNFVAATIFRFLLFLFLGAKVRLKKPPARCQREGKDERRRDRAPLLAACSTRAETIHPSTTFLCLVPYDFHPSTQSQVNLPTNAHLFKMAPGTPSPWKGALRYKRKGDLVELATALGITEATENSSKDDLEEVIRTHLLANRTSLASDPNWQGLYTSLDNGEKRAARGSSNALSP